MKFPYHVKHNGVDYEPFEEIDMNDKPVVEKAEIEPSSPHKASTKYTKTQINRLYTNDLQKIAKENGLDATKTGMELKKMLIEYFEL